MEYPEILTAQEVADIFRITLRTVYRKAESGEIPHFRVGEGGPLRFHREKIFALMSNQINNSIVKDA